MGGSRSTRGWRAVTIVASAAIYATATQAQIAQTPSEDPDVRQAIVHCTVAEGPKLRNCRVVNPDNLDATKKNILRLRQESIIPCQLNGMIVGTEIDRSIQYSDNPAFWRPRPTVTFNPDWAERPSAALVQRYYPSQAQRRRIGGRAEISCTVSLQGLAENCTVVSETPEGAGFGQALLKASSSFRFRPMTIDGCPVDGGKINVPVLFTPR